ncbi:hypothetical protein Adu01nite_06930 [Paractinoplanes durhamensis]|uniref:Uncharacterized protein n=1 Tax=Paractinoplanes durhamensis TaxID=113563 RepID=A0ABQ3YP30_9ACTN|nr:hypothetical protein Adu01nite_06930 [Actinoplanes durhamensis]
MLGRDGEHGSDGIVGARRHIHDPALLSGLPVAKLCFTYPMDGNNGRGGIAASRADRIAGPIE